MERTAAEQRAAHITECLDAIADNYTAVMSLIREAIEQHDDETLGYRSPGEYVADRFGGSLKRLGIDTRRAVVGELTAAGLTARAIAPVVGVSDWTVCRDRKIVEDSTARGLAVERSTTATPPLEPVGVNGKKYRRADMPVYSAPPVEITRADTEWSERVRHVSADCPWDELTTEQIRWISGAAEYLQALCKVVIDERKGK